MDERHSQEDGQASQGNAKFQQAVDSEGMEPSRHEAWKEEATGAHAPHEGAQEHAERDGGRADDQLEKLEPDNLVNEGGTTTSDKQQQNGGGNSRKCG